MSDFVISRFFSKSRRFEGQCQRDLRKGSPSSPVIFHRGGNWKWSIYRHLDPGLAGPNPKNRLFGRSCQTCQFGQVQPARLRLVRTAIWPGPAKLAGLARSSQDWRQTEILARSAVRPWNRQKSLKSRFFGKIDFSAIRQVSGPDMVCQISDPECHLDSTLSAYVHADVDNPYNLSKHACSLHACHHVHTQIVSKANSCMCTFLEKYAQFVAECSILNIRALWK